MSRSSQQARLDRLAGRRGRVAAAAGVAIDAPTLPQLRRLLNEVEADKTMRKALSGGQREIGKKAAGWAQTEARSLGGPYAHFAKLITGGGGLQGARLGLRRPEANATFWGAKGRSGWYADPKYGESQGRQHPEWVGANWQVAVPGQGPYALNTALSQHVDDIVEMYETAVFAVLDELFRPLEH